MTLALEHKTRRSNPHAVDIHLPCAQATGSGRAWAGHLPTAAFVSLDSTEPRLSLVDTGSTLSILDERLVDELHLRPLNGPGVGINGIGKDRSLGFVTLPFSIQGRRKDNTPTRLCSSTDFHVVRNFAPGICLGLDVIHSMGLIIDIQAGRAHVDEVSFPVFNTQGQALSPKNINKVVRVKAGTTVPAQSHSWVAVDHQVAEAITYTMSASAWLSGDEGTQLVLPAAVVDQHTTHVLVTNLGMQPHELSAGFSLGEATPLGPDDQSAETGSFLVQTHEDVTHVPKGMAEAFVANEAPDVSAEPLNFADDELARISPRASESHLVDGTFHVGLDNHGHPHADVVSLLRRHTGAFSLDGKPGKVRGEAMQIPLRESESLKPEAPRRVSPDKRQTIEQTLEQLLDWDVIEPSSSSVSFPVLLVRQGSKWRFCVDYRGLNLATVPDRYPLPRIDDVFEALAGNRFFSGLDAIRGYHQIAVAPEDRWKTAFVCHKGLYQYKRIPFGLRNAPSFFQRFMDQLLGNMRWTEALVYLDDVVVFSPTLEQHVRSLETLFVAAEKVGLKFSPSKCHFALPSLSLLGRHVSTAGISILQDRAAAVRELAPPRTLQQLYRVLGLFNYYRDFIPGYAAMAAPLTSLLKGHKYKRFGEKWYLVDQDDARTSATKVHLEWQEHHSEALEQLKQALSLPPTLA